MQSQTVNRHLYQPLGQDEIRLAHMLPAGDDTNPVEVRLETVSLDPKPDYDALSYCWGDPKVTRPICVNGKVVNVTVNLEAALRQLRNEAQDGEMRVWADAICINQSDLPERAQQVSIMFQIYEKASTVHIWLGELEARAVDGFRLLQRLLESEKGHELDFWDSDQQRVDGIETLACLCRAPYWKRIWIVQEVSHKAVFDARNLMHLGHESFHLPHWTKVDSVHAMQALDPAIEDISSAFHPLIIATWGFQTRAILESGDSAFARFVPTFMADLRKLLATDPRDKIYGILQLLPGALDIKADYSKSMRSVYSEATIQIMRITKTVFIMHQACSGDRGLPSWVPDYRSTSPMPTSFQHCHVRFTAGGASSLYFKHIDGGGLSMNGLIADEICHVVRPELNAVADRITYLSALQGCRAFFQRHCLSTPPGPERADVALFEPFWRTTCLGYTVETLNRNRNFEISDTATFEELLWKATVVGREGDEDYEELERVRHVISEHDFFVTATGHLGAVAQGVVDEGDSIVVFPTAHCPFAARELPSNGQRAFALGSPCYVDGVMHDEAAIGEAERRFGDKTRVQDVFENLTIV